MGLYQQASRLVEESERRIPATRGQYIFAEHVFYSFLTRAHGCSGPNSAGKRKHLRILEKKLRTMKKWAGLCRENFRHKQLLMEAELARIRGQNESAAGLYEEAISSACDVGFPFNAALGAELAGRFHLVQGREVEGKELLRRSRAGYLTWGAGAKVEALDEECPDLAKA